LQQRDGARVGADDERWTVKERRSERMKMRSNEKKESKKRKRKRKRRDE